MALGAAALAGALPTIGGFAPFPIGIMGPFMEWQSARTALGFGIYYQASKRNIDRMSNEEFNKKADAGMDFSSIMAPAANIINQNFIDQVQKVEEIQKTIIDKMVIIEKMKVEGIVRLWKELPKEYIEQLLENQAKALQDITVNIDSKESSSTTSRTPLNRPTTYDPNSDPNKFNPPASTSGNQEPANETKVIIYFPTGTHKGWKQTNTHDGHIKKIIQEIQKLGGLASGNQNVIYWTRYSEEFSKHYNEYPTKNNLKYK